MSRFGTTVNEFSIDSWLLGSLCNENKGNAYQWSADLQEREILWKARHNAYYAALAMRPGCSVRKI